MTCLDFQKSGHAMQLRVGSPQGSIGIYLRVMAAGKMNPMQTAAVAPVNWKASQILGIKIAAK